MEDLRNEMKEYTINVYMDNGNIFKYQVVGNQDKPREHSAAIVKDGYRHNDGSTYEHYGPA